ncbi:Translation initiation factor IF-2 [Orchesella cincta]|uniref:Translation initiation factor IF-2 n=1 Tax=Orchesella cincta TaxID=48709 RepID=A0A1D2NF25_ORCCI|nr:Translation initiation factor IF-2 [Orchesella cincta]
MESNSSSDIKEEGTPPKTSAMENPAADPIQAEAKRDDDGDTDSLDEVAQLLQNLTVVPDSKSAKPEEKCQVVVELEDKKDTGELKEPENIAKFHPFLLEFKNCFFNWILDGNPLSYEEAVAQQLHLAFCTYKDLDRELKIIGALINAGIKDRTLTIDQVEGLTYVYCGLLALKQSLLLLKLENEERNIEEMKLKEYITQRTSDNEPESYTASAKAAIKFVHSFFLGARRLRDQQLVVVEEIVTIEPRNVECWIYLYTCYKLDRKTRDYKAGPNEDEEKALYQAWKIDANHALVKLSLAIYLTDMLRAKQANFQKNGWVVLHEVAIYPTMDDVVDAIVVLTDQVMRGEGMRECVRTNVCIADIFSSGLPYNFRQDFAAKRYLEDAIAMNPSCSSAGHKLGLLKLKLGSPVDEALIHVRQAFVADQRNFPALIDNIQMLLTNPKDNKKREELMDLFLKNLDNDKWTEKQVASLYTTQAFFLFMIGEKEGAILALTFAHRIHGETVKDSLQKIPFLSKRYHWNHQLLSQQTLLSYIETEVLGKSEAAGNEKGFDMEICKNLRQYLDESIKRSGPSGSSIFSGRGGFRGYSRGSTQNYNGRGGSSNRPDLWRQGRDNTETFQGTPRNIESGRGHTGRGGLFSSDNRGRGGFSSSDNRGRGGFSSSDNRGRGGFSSSENRGGGNKNAFN